MGTTRLLAAAMLLASLIGCSTISELTGASQSGEIATCLRSGIQSRPEFGIDTRSTALALCLSKLVIADEENRLVSQERLAALGFKCEEGGEITTCRLAQREQYYSIGALYTRGQATGNTQSFVTTSARNNIAVDLRVAQIQSDGRSNDDIVLRSENLVETKTRYLALVRGYQIILRLFFNKTN